ncbi:hypothetical protein HDV03_001853 [Kappamyces sp. JEL0829]|nr:hypothetical protein HDV03_001853 [Kappamyces sp. JEL0829]
MKADRIFPGNISQLYSDLDHLVPSPTAVLFPARLRAEPLELDMSALPVDTYETHQMVPSCLDGKRSSLNSLYSAFSSNPTLPRDTASSRTNEKPLPPLPVSDFELLFPDTLECEVIPRTPRSALLFPALLIH